MLAGIKSVCFFFVSSFFFFLLPLVFKELSFYRLGGCVVYYAGRTGSVGITTGTGLGLD